MRKIVLDTNCLLATLPSKSPYHKVWEIDDNKFVDCAVCGNAECIVSNDNHFKILKETYFPYTTLYTLQEFCERLNKRGGE